MLTLIDIPSLIPHQRGMCLLEEVMSWDETCIVCRATSHRDPANPLRGVAGLLAVCGIEYAAQAVAVHRGLNVCDKPGFQTPANGYLANAKEVTWAVDRFDNIEADLMVEAEQLISEGGRSIYAFKVTDGQQALMQGRVSVVLEGATS